MRTKATLSWLASGTVLLLAAAWRPWAPDPFLVASRAAMAEIGPSEKLRTLLEARYASASKLLDLEERRLQQGVTTLGRVCEAARWVRDAAVELPAPVEERVAILSKYVELARRLEESVNRAVERGAVAEVDGETARYLRLDAEVALLRMRESGSR